MEHLTTRTGGESETQAGKLIPSFVIDTAGAPASAPSTAKARLRRPNGSSCCRPASFTAATDAGHFASTIRPP